MNKDGVLSRVNAGIIYNNLDNNGNKSNILKNKGLL